MNFASISRIDWDDLGKSIIRVKSPQLVKNHLDGKNAQFSLLDPLKKSQLEHTKEIVRLFDTLMEHIKKNEVAWCEYLKYLRLMFEQFENILVDRAPHLSLLLNDIQDDISREMAQFTKRVGRIFENLMEILKKLQKTIKEREFIELDYNNYASQKHKFDSTGDYPDFEKNKKAFEVEQKLKQIKNRGNILDSLITSETPLFLLLSDGISKGLGILIFFHSYDILKTFYEKFSKTSECLTNFQMDNIYLGNYTAETKQAQSKICDQIEFLKLFAKTTKPFQSVASSVPFSTELKTSPFAYNPKKVGTALYPFNGLHDFELSFDIGDKVEVYEENESGWWIGTLLRDGSYGRFPYNYFHFS